MVENGELLPALPGFRTGSVFEFYKHRLMHDLTFALDQVWGAGQASFLPRMDFLPGVCMMARCVRTEERATWVTSAVSRKPSQTDVRPAL